MLTNAPERQTPRLRAGQIVAGGPIQRFRWRDEEWVLMPTTYVFNNQASVEAVRRTWPWGGWVGRSQRLRIGLIAGVCVSRVHHLH